MVAWILFSFLLFYLYLYVQGNCILRKSFPVLVIHISRSSIWFGPALFLLYPRALLLLINRNIFSFVFTLILHLAGIFSYFVRYYSFCSSSVYHLIYRPFNTGGRQATRSKQPRPLKPCYHCGAPDHISSFASAIEQPIPFEDVSSPIPKQAGVGGHMWHDIYRVLHHWTFSLLVHPHIYVLFRLYVL